MRKGFTLIELLIVVAIIAILAAIAVPNFLEAQVRAKVSRAKADMRSLATAIESYVIDTNIYPICGQWVSFSTDRPSPDNYNNRMHGLTTPVAYITSLPGDPFQTSQANMGFKNNNPTYEYSDIHTYVVTENIIGTYSVFSDLESWNDYFANGIPIKWALLSAGPDQINDFDQLTILPIGQGDNPKVVGINQLYDSTNGTISVGDVTRTQAAQR